MSIDRSGLTSAPDTPLLSSGGKAEARPGSQQNKATASEGTASKGAASEGTAGSSNVIELYPGSRPGRRYRRRVRFMGSEAGMATAEYAIATLVAVPRGPHRGGSCAAPKLHVPLETKPGHPVPVRPARKGPSPGEGPRQRFTANEPQPTEEPTHR